MQSRTLALVVLVALFSTPATAQLSQQSIGGSVQRGTAKMVTQQGYLNPANCEAGDTPTFKSRSEPKLGKLVVDTARMPAEERGSGVFQCGGRTAQMLRVTYQAGSQAGVDRFEFYITKQGFTRLFTVTVKVE